MIRSRRVSRSGFDTSHLYNSFEFKDVVALYTVDEESEALVDDVNHRGCLCKTCNESEVVLNFQICAAFTGELSYAKCPPTIQTRWINI